MEIINDFEMKLCNKKVFEFYENNPSLSFEMINVLCVDLFENILQDSTITINNSITKQIFNKCIENNNKIDEINKNMTTINNNISRLTNELLIKFIDIKKDYIDEVKNIVNINSTEKLEKLNTHLKELFENTVSKDDMREITSKKTDLILDNIEKNHNILNNNFNDKTTINNHYLVNEIISKIDFSHSSKIDKFDDKINILMNKINTETLDKFNNLIASSNSHIVDKINIMLNQCLPENNAKINKQIQDEIHNFHLLITEETKKMTQNNNNDILHNFIEKYKYIIEDKTLSNELLYKQDSILNELTNGFKLNSITQVETFISNFDNKYNSLLQTIQKPIFELLSNNEERIIKNISSLNDSTSKQQLTQDKMLTNLDEFLNKYKNNSSSKGSYSEIYLKKVLEQIEGSEILDTSKIASSGDLLLKRINKPNILFENKEYTGTLPTTEVDKFIYDCGKQKTHGIILSQSSGIALKKNYQIEILDKKYILVYVSNVEYTFERIKIAIDIIDSLSEKLKEFDDLPSDETDECNISKKLLSEINEEYNKLILQKEAIINLVKDFQKKIIISIEEINLPSLPRIFNNVLPQDKNISSSSSIICNRCSIFVAKSKSALSAHQKSCKIITPNNTIIDPVLTIENTTIIEPTLTIEPSSKKQKALKTTK